MQRVFICTQLIPFEMNCAGQRNDTCTRLLLSIWSLRKSKKSFMDIQINTHPCYMFNSKCFTIQVFKGNFFKVTNVWYLYELNKNQLNTAYLLSFDHSSKWLCNMFSCYLDQKWIMLSFPWSFRIQPKGWNMHSLLQNFLDLWHLVNVHEFEKNIPYILFNITCDHATNLSTIWTEYLINSKKKRKKQTKYWRAYNKYNKIYPLNIEFFFLYNLNFILQIIFVETKR